MTSPFDPLKHLTRARIAFARAGDGLPTKALHAQITFGFFMRTHRAGQRCAGRPVRSDWRGPKC